MKTSLPIFLAVFVALGASFGGFVAGSISQLGTAKQTVVLNSADTYPVQRTGDAALGLQVYRANGCAVCHTEQVRQDGMDCDLVLTGGGKNPAAVGRALGEIASGSGEFTTNELPKTILQRVTKEVADVAADKITTAGGKAEVHINALGADISRRWGVRRSVATDYLWDYPVQLGNLRAGPDLANVGARMNELTQLQHLYAPSAISPKSVMPPFRYLFETHKMTGNVPSPDAVVMPQGVVPAGYEVIPSEDAKRLVAYLLSLRAEVPLYEAPFTPAESAPAPVASTNTPSK
jgi:cbb3-type cytochrome oxidase cytochrome c subunit